LNDVPVLSSQRQNNIDSYKNEALSLTRVALNSSAVKSSGTGVENNTTPGIYPGSLKITYYDDLKDSHDLVIDSPLQIKPQSEVASKQDNNLILILVAAVVDNLILFLVAAVVIAIGIVSIFIAKWLRSEKNKNLVSKNCKKVSKTCKKIWNIMTTTRLKVITGGNHSTDQRKGAPFSQI
jgi:hypothetical protein